MNEIGVTEKLDTHRHGRDYHQMIGNIGHEIGMEYCYMNTIIQKLRDKKYLCSRKILSLGPRAVYAFVLNYVERLRHIVCKAMSVELSQMQFDVKRVSKNAISYSTELLICLR